MSFCQPLEDEVPSSHQQKQSSPGVPTTSPGSGSTGGLASGVLKIESQQKNKKASSNIWNSGSSKEVDKCLLEGAGKRTDVPLSKIVPTTDADNGEKKQGIIRVPSGAIERCNGTHNKGKPPTTLSSATRAQNTSNRAKRSSISACETDFSNVLSHWSGSAAKFSPILSLCANLQQLWRQTILYEGCSDAGRLWQNCHYPIIETTRRLLGKQSTKSTDNIDALKKVYLEFLELSKSFYSQLMEELPQASGQATDDAQWKHKEKLNKLMCHHFNLFVGDLCRYQQQLMSKPDWGQPRKFYLKAQQLAPRNGKSYNQLAVIAIHAHRRLDAVYYYVRSLMSSNPFLSAKESLSTLFEETGRKAEKEEERLCAEGEKMRKRREKKNRRHTKETVDSEEVWILPWQEVSPSELAAGRADCTPPPMGEDALSKELNAEMMKSLVLSMLIVHGKLFTKIGLEQISGAIDKCLSIWRTVLCHKIAPKDASVFLKMLILCLFSIHYATSREPVGSPAYSYFCGLAVSFALQFVLEALRACDKILSPFSLRFAANIATTESKMRVKESRLCSENPDSVSCNEDSVRSSETVSEESLRNVVGDLSCYLPLVKIWFNWIGCQRQLWCDCSQQIKQQLLREHWHGTETLLNQLNHLKKLFPHDVPTVSLWEDKSLAGFMPLDLHATLDESTDVKDLYMEGVWRVVVVLRSCGHLFANAGTCDLPLLCNGGRFVLQQEFHPVGQEEEDKMVASEVSDDECSSDSVIVEEEDDIQEPAGVHRATSDIDKLRIEKVRLTKKLETQQQTKQDIQELLKSRAESHAKENKVVVPRYIVLDTNCFINHLISIQQLARAGHFTVAIPLTVVIELEGLMKGLASGEDSPVPVMAKKSHEYLKQCFELKERCVKLLTTKGNFLSTMTIRSEICGIQICNDDYILLSSISLHGKVDDSIASDAPRRFSVVLLTDDRNLRVKAYAQGFPVKSIPDFMAWCKL